VVVTTQKRVRRTPEAARREILDAAEDLLKDMRFRDLEVDEVMARTGMKRSTFYNYFSDRNELVMRLVERIADEMFAATADWLDGRNEDRVEAVRQGLREVARIWSQHAAVLSAMNEASYHDEAAQHYFRGGVVQAYIDRVAARLRREKKAGLTRVRNPAETARALMLLNINYMTERLRTDGAKPENVAAVLEDVWLAVLYPDAR
jgi:AcrR family transcriptional regulator